MSNTPPLAVKKQATSWQQRAAANKARRALYLTDKPVCLDCGRASCKCY